MSYHNQWYIPGKIIYTRFDGDLTEDDLEALTQQLMQMMAPYPRFVHVINDLRNLGAYPRSLGKINATVRQLFEMPQYGWLCVIGVNDPLTNFISSTIAKVMRVRYKTVETVEEALTFLQQSDAEIDFGQADESVLVR